MKEENKPRTWILYVTIIILIASLGYLAYQVIKNRPEKSSLIPNIFENNQKEDDKFSVTRFNLKFTSVEGRKSKFWVEQIIDDVVTSNKTNDRKITVIFKDKSLKETNELKDLKDELVDDSEYEVSLEYDKDGYIYEISFEEKIKDVSVNIFNIHFSYSEGTQKGIFVKDIIENIVTSNKKYPNHIIKLVYKGKEIKSEEMTSIKKSLGDFTDYEVVVDYDEKKYVSKITIE